MILLHCPNCEYENKPGERFCASCGVPLDLKPCPSCGKVDSVKATVCTGCGAAFPPIDPAHVAENTSATADRSHANGPPLVLPPTTVIRAWPLIVVALTAAGLPLLWVYRDIMPLPKAWQSQVLSAESSNVAPPLPPAQPPAKNEPARKTGAPVAASQEQSVAEHEPVPKNPVPVQAVKTAQTMQSVQASRPKPPVQRAPAQPRVAAKPQPATKEGAATAGTCTEALAAVGLCDPGTTK